MIKLIKSTFYHEPQVKRDLCEFIRRAKQLSFGRECLEFEHAFAAWQGSKHCIMLNSGSSANLALIQTLLNLGRLKRGDPVGFSAVTWSTNVMPLLQLGLTPVPVDVELGTLNVSPRTLNTVHSAFPIKALFLTDLLGFADDIAGIRDYCRKKRILFLEDTCESLGSVYRGLKLGNFGSASTFSFYVGHHLSTVEGGAVCTDDEELATMLSLVRAHGWDRNLTFAKQEEIQRKFRINSTFYSRYTFYDLGYNLRPTEIAGFLGRIQLRYADEIVAKRERNFRALAGVLYAHTTLYYPLEYTHLDTVSNFAVPLICRSRRIRDDLVNRSAGRVEIRPIVGGDMLQQPFLRRYLKSVSVPCPNARLIHENGLYFGNNPEMTGRDLSNLLRIFAPARTAEPI
jgi:CDP-4-dehydro-6-deoxyglucose reductase, E1